MIVEKRIAFEHDVVLTGYDARSGFFSCSAESGSTGTLGRCVGATKSWSS